MPRADDPRVVVRMSGVGFASVKRAADSVGVSVGGLVRECAERYAVQVAQAVERGEIEIRRSNGPDAVTGPSGVVAPRLSPPSELQVSRQARVNALGRAKKPAARGVRS